MRLLSPQIARLLGGGTIITLSVFVIMRYAKGAPESAGAMILILALFAIAAGISIAFPNLGG